MSLYAKLATNYQMDEKILAAGPMAELLWVRGLCWSKDHLRDGEVPRSALALVALGLADPGALAVRLVEVGLWEPCEGGWRVPPEKWAAWQTTREQVEEMRRKRSEAGQKGAASRWHGTSDGTSHSSCHDPAMAEATPVPEARNDQSTEPEPEPEPERIAQSPESSRVSSRAPSRHRLPPEWTPTPEGVAYATERHLDAADQLAAFTDHHRAKATVMADWDAGWRTWCRNAVTFAQRRPAPLRAVNGSRFGALAELHSEYLAEEGRA